MGQSTDGGPHKYQVTIHTGQGIGAGTTAKVSLLITGENGDSGVIPISKLTTATFNRASQTRTSICLPAKLGPLLYINIWHDNGGSSPAWFLSNVNIRDIHGGDEWNFVYDRWLAVESDECRTDALIYAANPTEFNSYKRIYISKTSTDLYDGHLWFSVAAKPPTSHFTRVQRCSCCLSLLFCTMMTNCMFYNINNDTDTTVVIIGPFKVSLRVLIIGIQSSLIVFPINLLLTFLFRKSTELGDPKKSSRKSLHHLQPGPFFHLYTECCKNKNKSFKNRCRAVFNNRVLYYIAWVLCILTIATSFTVTLMYTLQWDKELSQRWLISFLTSFCQDALITQPIKVLALAAIIAFIIKERKTHKKSKYRSLRNTRDAELISIDMNSENSHHSDVASKYKVDPPNKQSLQNARRLRLKQLNTYNVLKDVVWYAIFLFLLMTYSYGHMDPLSYEFTKEIGNLFIPHLVSSNLIMSVFLLPKVVVRTLFHI